MTAGVGPPAACTMACARDGGSTVREDTSNDFVRAAPVPHGTPLLKARALLCCVWAEGAGGDCTARHGTAGRGARRG